MGGALKLQATALMGWVMLAALGFAAMGSLMLLRVGRAMWAFVAAALMLGAAGYALQGRPTLGASPARSAPDPLSDDPEMLGLRAEMFGRYGPEGAYLTASDGMARAGETKAAVQVLLGGIRGFPNSAMLWTALGNAYAAHDGGQVSPAAMFAFRHAMRLAPDDPGPVFFLGLAFVRAGDLARTQAAWSRAYAMTPPGAAYRDQIGERLNLLNRLMQMQQAGQSPL